MVSSCLAFTACNQITRDVEGIVLSVEGPVTVKHRGAAHEEALSANARFSEGDLITSGNSAQTCLMLLPGTLVALDSDSTLDVKQLRVGKDGNALENPMRMRTARVHLVRGGVTALVEPSDTPKVYLKVTVQQNEATGSGGCTFHVATNAERPRVVCVRGEIRVERGGQETMTIAAGFFSDLPDSTGAPKPADLDAAAQDYLLQGFEEENKLRLLENQMQFAPAPWRKKSLQKP